MPKEPTVKEARRQHLRNWITFLSQRDVLDRLKGLTPADIAESGTTTTYLCAEAARIWSESIGLKLSRLGELLNQARKAEECTDELRLAIENFWACKQATIPPHVTHGEKREIAEELGFHRKHYYLQDLIAEAEAGGTAPPFTLRQKLRDHHHGVKWGAHLSEVEDKVAGKDVIVTTESTGFDVVYEDQSVIYYSVGDDGKTIIELIVLRDVLGKSRYAGELFAWMHAVIVEACKDRTNVRPNHTGKIVQLGLNMGARSARAIGLASSFKLDLDKATKAAHDQDAVGVISLAWGLMEKLMPQEVINITRKRLTELGLPELETANLRSGGGYTIKIGGSDVTFPTAKRAPPEGYLSNGYEARAHEDKAYTPYAFAFNIDRRINPKKVPSEPSEPVHQTRTAIKKQKEGPAPVIRGPPGGGSSFVDLSLKVVVRQALGTMMAIRPEFMHGTSMGYGAENSGVTISFSERIVEAWETARRLGITVESFQDTGDGN
ncbi:hypothetical protein BDZ97DRAFT_1704149 [Flammula alnicola]|nr:hypothetical protein BDZ97DRAFT_1704149 [Flammula alnicola]